MQINLGAMNGVEYQIPIEQGDLIQKRNFKQLDMLLWIYVPSKSYRSFKEFSKKLRECIPEVRFKTIQKSWEGLNCILKYISIGNKFQRFLFEMFW